MADIRFFADDDAIRHVGEGLIGRSLARPAWTHEAHLAATVYIVRERPDIDAERDLPAIIRAYNESVGGVNDDSQGYHETITQCFLSAVRAHLAARPAGEALVDSVNALLGSQRGMRDWPLRFYTRETLFSVAARRGWIAPDR